jgi:hypothetical protein
MLNGEILGVDIFIVRVVLGVGKYPLKYGLGMPCHAGQVIKGDYKVLVDLLRNEGPVADEFCPEVREKMRDVW